MKIIIAYDGSESSDAAIADLLHAGLPKGVDALVMSLADVFLPPPINEEIDDTFPFQVPAGVRAAHKRAEHAVEQAELLAKQASKRIQESFPEWSVRHEAYADSPAWAVIKKADEWKPDLVVVGAHGHSLLGGRLILGSVSQRILYEAGCSVRIARGRREAAQTPPRIVIGVDGSPYSDKAIDAVSKRQWPTETQVRLLTVVDTVMLVMPNAGEPPVLKWIEVEHEKDWDQVRELFESSVEKLRSTGLDAAVMIRRGNPKEELLEEAETWGANSVFLGAKGVRGVERLLLGSVSSTVAARAHCSVEIVRAAHA
jgi:nucleotide-binding universal stress UspA family protein